MTDVKVVARPNYCRGRQPRLRGCQSELVGAGSKLSSQRFGLALHIRSLVLCRLWVLANTHTYFCTHNSSCIHTCSLCAGGARAQTFALAGWVTDHGTEKDFQLAGNKNWHNSRIEYARISLSRMDGIKAFQNGSAEMRHLRWNFLNWFRGLCNWWQQSEVTVQRDIEKDWLEVHLIWLKVK